MRRARGKTPSNKKERTKYDSIDVPASVRRSSSDQQYATRLSVKRKPVQTVKKKKKKLTMKQKRRNFFLVLIGIALIIFFGIMGKGWGNGDDEGALIPVDNEVGKVNILLLGVDNDGMRTDAMMLVSYNFKENNANIISIPRDTRIKVTDRGVTRKINEIHAMHDENGDLIGPLGSVRAVSALTGIPIHYYFEFSFKAIDEFADIVGPIEFDVPDVEGDGQGMNYDDPAQDLHIHLKPGLQKLKGNQVQQFLRYRKSSNPNAKVDGSDLSRVKRQQEFIKAAIDQKVNIGLIAKVPSIFSKLKKNIKTNFSAGDLIKYAKYLNGITGEAIQSFSLPGESKRTGAGWYFICDIAKTKELVVNTFGYDVDTLSESITLKDLKGMKNALSASKNDKSEKEENTQNAESQDEETPSPTPEQAEDTGPTFEVNEDSSENNNYDYDNEDSIGDEPSDIIISTPQKTEPQITEQPVDDGYILLD